MCNKLLQLYACGHDKTICITPCPHAVATGEQEAPTTAPTELQRSSSTVSSLHRSDTQSSQDPGVTWGGVTSPFRQPAPAFRLRIPGQADTYQTSTAAARDRLPSPPASSLSRPLSTIPIPPSPTPSTSTHTTHIFTATPEPPPPVPNFCACTFPRYLPQSLRPCLKCFVVGEEWEKERERMREKYRVEHAGVRREDVERECGLEKLRGEFGA